MTADSVWLIERRVDETWVLIGDMPIYTKSHAEYKTRQMNNNMYGGEYRAVEYRRVKEGE